MKVAILGHGRQGRKHAYFWSSIAGVELDIFTRSGGEGVLTIENFIPHNYAIIIAAIAPIDEQTQMLEYILQTQYRGYLIIEKPVTYVRKLFAQLVARKKTIFFIDELFHPDYQLSMSPTKICTRSFSLKDTLNITEHAIGLHLLGANLDFNFDSIEYVHEISQYPSYTVYFGAENKNVTIDLTKMNFSETIDGLLNILRDEYTLGIMRNNYFRFRCSQIFSEYML